LIHFYKRLSTDRMESSSGVDGVDGLDQLKQKGCFDGDLEGLESLCLGEELTQVVAAKLGAKPKTNTITDQKRPAGKTESVPSTPKLGGAPRPSSAAKSDQPNRERSETSPPQEDNLPPKVKEPEPSPALVRKQAKKKNRKDRRRNQESSGVRAEGTQGVERSNSAACIPSGRLPNSRNRNPNNVFFSF